MLLTKESGILKPFAMIIGYMIEGIYWILSNVGIPNIGLSIVLLTIVIYVLMIPLTYKQQKFSKLSAKMNPEIQAIQAKYKGKTDQESMMRMQSETQNIYAKYGVSPSGSCLQLLITMPILFALYRVIYNIPAYITSIGNVYRQLSDKIVSVDNGEFIRNSGVDTIANTVNVYGKHMTDGNMSNGVIDVLNRLSSADLNIISEHYGLADIVADNGDKILSTLDSTNKVVESGFLEKINSFIGLNIANSPSFTLKTEWALGSDKSWLIIIGVLMIPVLSALTQFINVKLMPQPETSNQAAEESAMMSSMKTMNTVMPLFSAVMCYTLPVGVGIYWITGSVVRTIIQIILNKRIDKIDIDEMIKKNVEKNNKKREKQGLPPQSINSNATMNTKNVDRKPNPNATAKKDEAKRAANIKESTEYYNNANSSKAGSLASKAFMVKNYNEKNNEKKDN